MVAASKKTEWIRNLLLYMKLWLQSTSIIFLYCDNEATISWVYNNIYNDKSRHISIRHWYVQELIANEVITIIYVKYVNNLTDPLIKGLSRDMTRRITSKIGWNLLLNIPVMKT